jgi:hypothetical protein
METKKDESVRNRESRKNEAERERRQRMISFAAQSRAPN